MPLSQDLKKISFFENLDDKELELISSFSKKRNFSAGEILFYEKEIPSSLILLTEGILKVYKTDPKNNEIVLHRFQPMDLVAEVALFEGIPYPASASFDVDGSVVEIDFNKFKKHFFNNPEITFNLFKSLSQKIKNLERIISLNIVLDSTARIAKYICENDNALDIKHSQLAQYLHMTPETLSRVLKKLVVLELIEKVSNKYVVKDRERLMVLFE